MKAFNLLTLLLCLFTFSLQAQTYNFESDKGVYTNLVGSTSLNNGQVWDDPTLVIPFGFNFLFFDQEINTAVISDFGLGGFLFATNPNDPNVAMILLPYGADIIDRGFTFPDGTGTSESNISYLIDGEPGSRILKVEWNNVGFYGEAQADNESTDFTNFQMWLYQGSNMIEFRYGPNSITQPELCYEDGVGTFLGIVGGYDIYEDTITTAENYLITGDPSSPTTMQIGSQEAAPTLTGTIPNGTIYRFSSLSTGINDLPAELNAINLFPNLVVDHFTVQYDASKVEINSIAITNVAGQVVKNINYSNNDITVSDLSAGVYFVNLNTDLGVVSRKIVKR